MRVKPGSKQEKIVKNDDGSLVVYCHARAHDGEANTAIIKLVAKELGVTKSQIEIIHGLKGRDKILEIS